MKKREQSRPEGAGPAGRPFGLLALIRDGGPLFKDVFTIDPSFAEDAWDTLSIDTSVIEYAELPKLMHQGLLDALKESRISERSKDENDRASTEAEPEILPKNASASSSGAESYLAHLTSFAQRPDLFLAEVEKHDPGFTKRINERMHENSERDRETRFLFGKVQAWASLGIGLMAAFATLFLLYLSVKNNAGFWTIIGLSIFFAIVSRRIVKFHGSDGGEQVGD